MNNKDFEIRLDLLSLPTGGLSGKQYHVNVESDVFPAYSVSFDCSSIDEQHNELLDKIKTRARMLASVELKRRLKPEDIKFVTKELAI